MHVRRALIVGLILAALLLGPALALAQDGSGQVTYTVQPGDTLYAIAVKYNTNVTVLAQANNITNPSLVLVGQVLVIPTGTQLATPVPVPTVAGAATPVPTAVPPTTGETVHVVQVGENLFRIALQYGLATSVVAAYNGIDNPNVIYVGQRIRIPAGGTAPAVVPTPVPTVAPVATQASTSMTPPTALPAAPVNQATNVGFAYGIQIHLPNQSMPQVMQAAEDLGVTWVKQQVEWALYEPTAGSVNWEPLDDMVAAMEGAGFKILLTVTSAPQWARDSSQEKGPPSDYQTYANFVGQLALRYKDRVAAYEIWNEPNLRREWNTSKGISAGRYVEMLRLAYRV